MGVCFPGFCFLSGAKESVVAVCGLIKHSSGILIGMGTGGSDKMCS